MSYTRRCASAPIGQILKNAKADPMWEVSVLRSTELCLQHLTPKDQLDHEFEGHYIFPFINVKRQPNEITRTVACYGFVSKASDKALLKLIRASK